MVETMVCCKCGGTLIGFDRCPMCDIPMIDIKEANLFKDFVCNTCGKAFNMYDEILSHYCNTTIEPPAQADAKPVDDCTTCRKNGHCGIAPPSDAEICQEWKGGA